jgi:ABC-type multidrug transport system fused ATPase/permease subunit
MLLPLLQLAGVGGGTAPSDAVTVGLTRLFAMVGAHPTLPAVLALYVGVAVVQTTVQRWQAVATASVEQDIVIALRRRVYHAIGNAEWIFFARQRTSDSLHVLTAEIERAGGAVYYAIDLLAASAVAAVYFALAFRMSPPVTLGVAAFGLLLALAMHRDLSAAKSSGAELSQRVQALHAAIAQHLAGLKTAMSFGAIERHEASFARLTHDVRDVRTRAARDYGRFRHALKPGITRSRAFFFQRRRRVSAHTRGSRPRREPIGMSPSMAAMLGPLAT